MSKNKTTPKHDYYKLLGVEKDCSDEDIKQSYRKLAKQYHPDLNPKANQAEITTKFQEITEAYEILSNPDKRQQYDAFGESGLNGQSFDQTDSVMNPFDMYLNQFGFFQSLFGGQKPNATTEEPEEEMVIAIEATLEELYHGCKREYTKKRKILCRTCNGTGALSNEHVFYCKACKGTGRRIMRRTLPRNIVQQFSTICMDCEGRGQYITQKCETCKGRKLVNEVKTVTVNVEPGSADGDRIVLKNQGDEWQNKSTGDIIFQIHQAPHKEFQRIGDDLLIYRTITLLEALTGFNITINSIENNSKILVKVDEVIQPGQKKAIPGKGMPVKGKKGQYGNLVVLFDVIFPEHLNMEMKEYLKIILDPKTKDLKKIPTLNLQPNTVPDISAFEINNTKGGTQEKIHSFLPGHYGNISQVGMNSNQSSSQSSSGGNDQGIFSFLKNKMTCSIFITRHEDVNHLAPKKGENGENVPPLKRKKGVNYDISLTEFNEMFSKTPPQQSDTSSNSGKLNPFNSHIERKDDTTFWIYDPTDFDPWFVARFIPEDTSMTIGSFVEIIMSTTAPRFCRNIMNALQVAFKFASEINVNCFFKDHNKSHQVTADFLKKILYDPHMVFIKGKQKEWLDRMEMIVEKKMAPLEFPLGNIDMIRDFFAFEISDIPDILNVFKHLNKNIPPMLSVAALDANIMEIAEFRSATPEERSVSKINLNDIYSCLIVDRKCKICKCKVEWDPAAKVLRISPNYLAKPPITGLYRCLPFHSVANCTFLVCKSVMTFLNKPWSECTLHSKEMDEDFIKKVQEKLKLDPISIEFYQWIMQAMKDAKE